MLWTATLETGIPKIDEQHKELFRQVDVLMDAKNQNRLQETLDFLGQYVVKHFGDEQVMHASSNYPKAAAHKQMHTAFIATFKELKQKFESSGHNLTMVMEINKVVVGWLKDHIMRHDKEFAAYYKGLGK
ncbi:MAG: bacteriohemerythrin [Candidatus Adiutrix sp.]|jgi:hemerythrin|nr:bacteriohemerythrin [Candidatus Adiutrix sp.]